MPHPSGRAAMRMLENEGFAYENYVDIFDGGPTMTARTDRVRTICEAKDAPVIATDADHGEEAIIACGRLAGFRAAFGCVGHTDGGIALSPACAQVLGVVVGDVVSWIARV